MGDDEQRLVQSIIDTQWRLDRIPSLIAGIYALGRINHAEMFADQPEHLRVSLLETHILQTYRRDLSNLALQERRLRNHRERDIEELKSLQAERRKREEAGIKAAADLYHDFKKRQLPFATVPKRFDPAEFGFEFSMEQIEYQLALQEGRLRRVSYLEQFAKVRAAELRRERLAA
ncbi:MAG TPA: hypothetical protein VKX25_18550 [Bryobacteraceae bacterium]|nr:hypothetical protein [Bryobacteraceae bacterium]